MAESYDYSQTQPGRRRNFNVTDQWGRMWLVSAEKSTGHATGAIQTCFTDPLATPQKYLSIPEDRPYSLVIDYDQWVRDLEEAHQLYHDRLVDAAQALYGEKAHTQFKKPTAEVQRIVGKPPLPIEDVRRAAAGDRALLGLPPLEAARPEKPARSKAAATAEA